MTEPQWSAQKIVLKHLGAVLSRAKLYWYSVWLVFSGLTDLELAVKRRVMKAVLIGLMSGLVVVGWLANRDLQAESAAEKKEAQSLLVVQKLTQLMSSIKDAENGQRGYLITGRQDYLKPYHASLGTLSKTVTELMRLNADNPLQQQRLTSLTQLLTTKLAVLEATIKIREDNGFAAAQQQLLLLPGLQLMDEIRLLMAAAEAAEISLLESRAATYKANSEATNQSLLLAGTLAAFALLLLLICLRWEMQNARLSEAQKNSNRAQYLDLFNSIEEGFCIIELIFDTQKKPIDYRFLEVNPSFERQTGIRHAVDRRILEIAPDNDAHWFESYGKVALTGNPHRFASNTKSLNERWFDVYAYRVGGEESAKVAVVFNDVSRRQQNQEKILRLNAGLEARVRQRTIHLEAANQQLESFSYSVSHDLRSPLNTISMFSDLLAKAVGDKAGEKGTQYLSRIHDGTQLMRELIEGLLSLAQLSHDKLQFEPVDLSNIARKKFQECQELEPARRAQIHIEEAIVVQADPRMLAVVIQNLLANAWKFSAMRALTQIEIGSQTSDAGGLEETVYFVKDNGVGFDMASAKNLFGAFERLHSQTEFSGTGIGLATAKRVIDRHGGRIWAESAEDMGATFYFTLR